MAISLWKVQEHAERALNVFSLTLQKGSSGRVCSSPGFLLKLIVSSLAPWISCCQTAPSHVKDAVCLPKSQVPSTSPIGTVFGAPGSGRVDLFAASGATAALIQHGMLPLRRTYSGAAPVEAPKLTLPYEKV